MANLEGIVVTAFLLDSASNWKNAGSSTTDENGNYSINGLPGGTYKLKFADPVGDWTTEYSNDAESLDVAQGFSVAGGATKSNMDAVLTGSAIIEGTVTDV